MIDSAFADIWRPGSDVGYLTAVTESRVAGRGGGLTPAAADARQGNYFRSMLETERDAVRKELAQRRSELKAVKAADDAGTVDRLCGEIIAKELELGHLAVLIEALDERFASHWDDD